MEMHQIRYFLAVARLLNFTRAADECHVAQPSLTRAIQKLEEELGGLLFHRERARTHLTELGRLMLPHLEQTYQAAAAAKMLAQGIRKGEVAPLRLGLGDSVSSHVVTDLLSTVSTSVEGLSLTLARGRDDEVVEQALDGVHDLIIVSEPSETPERMRGWTLFREDLLLAIAEDHPLAELDQVPVDALDGHDMIDQIGSPWMVSVVTALKAEGVQPLFRHRAHWREDALRLVAAGFGAGLVPRHAPLIAGVVTRPFAARDVARQVILGTVAGRPFSVATEVCLRLARSRAWRV